MGPAMSPGAQDSDSVFPSVLCFSHANLAPDSLLSLSTGTPTSWRPAVIWTAPWARHPGLILWVVSGMDSYGMPTDTF